MFSANKGKKEAKDNNDKHDDNKKQNKDKSEKKSNTKWAKTAGQLITTCFGAIGNASQQQPQPAPTSQEGTPAPAQTPSSLTPR